MVLGLVDEKQPALSLQQFPGAELARGPGPVEGLHSLRLLGHVREDGIEI